MKQTKYILIVDGKEIAKHKMLSKVAIQPKELKDNVEDYFEIQKVVNGTVVKKWGYTVNPVNGQKIPYADNTPLLLEYKINEKAIRISNKAMKKFCEMSGKSFDLFKTLKNEYKVRKNLKLLERKAELFDL